MKKLISSSVFCFLMGTMLFGQQETQACGTYNYMEEVFKLYPENRLAYEINHVLASQKSLQQAAGMEKHASYTIPVVFHILHEYGVENIGDFQVYDAMEVINREFNSADDDSVNVVAEFDTLIGNGHIEFKLAAIDPFGNCTNGINHVYSHETRIGDSFSKLHQWNRSRYLNIWVVKVVGSVGAAAYAVTPSGTDGSGFWLDGIVSNHTYVGSIGTSAPFKETTLTHEIAHCLNVSHVWGPTNDPGVTCGDDGVTDTPITKGYSTCPAGYPAAWMDCSMTTIIDTLGTYKFNGVVPTSGVVDPSPVPAQSYGGQDPTIGMIYSNFTAVGVGSNPTTTGTFGFDGWDTGALDGETVYANLTGVINTAKYYEFTVIPNPSSGMILNNLIFDVARDTMGPRTYAVRWSEDAYANNISLTAASSTNPNITVDVAGDVFFYNQDSTYLESGTMVNLGGMDFNSVSPVTFRIYGWNAEDAAGDFIVDNVMVNGNFAYVENVQNYMDYSYCSIHFTPGQVDRMHNALEGIAGQRNNLWLDTTLVLTGVKNQTLPQTALTVPLCTPVSDFSASTRRACVGQNITFSDASWNAVIDSRVWTFQDGSPATSTSANPVVSFTSAGYKKVTLASTNANGTGTEERAGYVYIANDGADFSAPVSINLESGNANWFTQINYEENYAKFGLSSGTGYNNSRSYKLNNFKDVSGADPFNDDFFYNNRLGLNKDELITPAYDMRYMTNVTFEFKFSYATNATQIAQMTENLKVFYSRDCGETWLPKILSIDAAVVGTTVTGSDIVTGGFAGYFDYAPTSNNDWKTASCTHNPTSADNHTRFKFVFEASDYASNLYIDEVNLSGTLSLIDDEIALLDLSVFPNPTTNGNAINVSYTAQDEAVTFTLRDVHGKIITSEVLSQTNTLVNHTLSNTENLNAACYFLEVKSGDYITTKKVVVL